MRYKIWTNLISPTVLDKLNYQTAHTVPGTDLDSSC